MNNFISTEKSLKRWLKNRVTVTTATVVGFLIMGTAVFAMNVNGKAVDLTENGFELTQEYIVGKQNVNGKTAGAVVVETAANEKLTISKVLENKTENAESWLLSVQGGQNGITTEIGKDAVLSGKNLSRVTLNLWGKTTTTNNGIIEKAERGWAAMTISGAKEGTKATFTNKGTVKGDINVEDNVELTNTGVIEGKIYADKAAGNKAITLSGKDSKVGAIELKKGETTNNTLIITNGVNDTIDNVTGLDKITVDGSDVIISAGEMKTALKNGNGLVDINDSNVDINVNIEGTGDRNGTSSLIQNYGKTKGEYKLTNRGNLISEKAQNVVYTNAASDVKMKVENSGNITLGTKDSKWATGLNGKFDSGVSNAVISMTNEGQITVTNGAGMDITNVGADSNIGTMTNAENGVITASGFSVGMLATGKGVEAVNKGTIIMNDATREATGEQRASYGMQSKDGALVRNEGTIILKYTDTTDVKAMGASGKGTTGINTGKIKLSNISALQEGMTKEKLAELLFDGIIDNNGMIVNNLGVDLFADANVGNENDLTGSTVDVGEIGDKEGTLDKVTVGTAGATINGSTDEKDNTINTEVFNASGKVNIEGGADKEVIIKADSTNLDVNGQFAVTDNTTLGFSDGTVNAEKTDADGNEIAAVTLGTDSILKLDGTTFSGNIGEEAKGTVNAVNATINGNITVDTLAVTGAETEEAVTYVDGKIAVNEITVGDNIVKTFTRASNLPTDVKDTLKLSSSSEFTTAGTLTINDTGKVVLEVGAETDKDGIYIENAFANSGVAVSVGGTGELQLSTNNISGETAVISFGTSTVNDVTLTTDSDIYVVDKADTDLADGLTLKYDKELYKDNAVLNGINNAAAVLTGGTFSQNKAERAAQLDKIYAENIYSETVRAAYDSLKISEEAVLSLAHETKAGEFKADGKALYSKDEYTKDGSIGSYDAEVETTGLLASLEYGVSDTSTAGVVFSGVKQDVDTDGGSADADLFYFGVFGTKTVGNYDFTAGLGYQFGEYEADNNIANIAGSDKYDSTAISGYVQGRYTADLGDGLSVQPKVKLGYTYLEQDDAKDSYFGVSDAELSTFDAELGLDVVKSVQFEKTKLDVKFGTSYVRTMGDTDEMFKGHFYGNGTNSFNVIGAELAENVIKFNLGAEAAQENGFFYNGGFTYEFGSNDTEAYGVNVGAGYKF